VNYKVRLTAQGLGDLIRLYDFPLKRDLDAAERALAAIERALTLLAYSKFSCRKALLQKNPRWRELLIPFGHSGETLFSHTTWFLPSRELSVYSGHAGEARSPPEDQPLRGAWWHGQHEAAGQREPMVREKTRGQLARHRGLVSAIAYTGLDPGLHGVAAQTALGEHIENRPASRPNDRIARANQGAGAALREQQGWREIAVHRRIAQPSPWRPVLNLSHRGAPYSGS
jgi:hypothetical protein